MTTRNSATNRFCWSTSQIQDNLSKQVAMPMLLLNAALLEKRRCNSNVEVTDCCMIVLVKMTASARWPTPVRRSQGENLGRRALCGSFSPPGRLGRGHFALLSIPSNDSAAARL